MIEIALFMAGGSAAYAFVRWLNLPATPLLLIIGFAVGRIGLLPRDLLQDALVLGLTFLMFVLGIELSPRQVRAQKRAAVRVGLAQFITLGLLGLLSALALGFDLVAALYLGLALTASSTLVIVRLLQQRKQFFEPYGRLVIGVLLLQNVLIILLTPVLTRLPGGWTAVAGGVLGTATLVVLAFVAQRWLTPAIVKLQHEEEVLLLGALAVLFVFIGIADQLALPLAAGAFLAGFSLSSFPLNALVRGPLTPVVSFFTTIFFFALGGILSTPGPQVLLHAVVLTLVVVVATPIVVTVVAERAGFVARPALEAGLTLSQTSELSLVVGLHALLLGQLAADAFSTLALVTVATMVLTPFLAREQLVRRLLQMHPTAGRVAGEAHHDQHIVLIGCGSGGMPLLETLLAEGASVVVIDDDPEIVARLRDGDVDCVHGDSSDPGVLQKAGVQRARLISSTIRRPRDNQHLLDLKPQAPVLVRVFDEDDVAWVEQCGGIPILYSEAAAGEFIDWFRSAYAGPAGPNPRGGFTGPFPTDLDRRPQPLPGE